MREQITVAGNKLISEYPVRREFEVVEQVESHYFPWINLGEYIGMAEFLDETDPYNSCKVNDETLKAIKLTVEEAKLLISAKIRFDIKNAEIAKKAIRCKRTGTKAERKRAIAKQALPILERIIKA